jgi:hypothetical protein
MNATQVPALRIPLAAMASAILAVAAPSALGQDKITTYEGSAARIGRGSAHTFVRTDANGKPISIGVAYTASALEGLPKAAKGTDADFPYLLSMPRTGPKTVVDHVVINWESTGHPPPKVYDVPHFDFHFYLVSRAEQMQVRFKTDSESGDPRQQPPAELLPAGYVVPPGTAVSRMGVHAIDPASPEFREQPFTATFIYGYYNKQLTFIEPMASLAFLQSKPTYSAQVARPASYSKAGAYPSSYSIKYDEGRKSYEVTLADLR